MQHFATILSGDESLAAEIFDAGNAGYLVRCIDNDARRDAGIDAVVTVYRNLTGDTAVRAANAWVTQTPFSLAPRGWDSVQA